MLYLTLLAMTLPHAAAVDERATNHPLRPPAIMRPVDSTYIEEHEVAIDVEKLKLWTELLGERPDSLVRLTEKDFVSVAEELGVEVAALKAVVEIEAGKSHRGFSAPGMPVINFDLAMFRQFARRNGVGLSKYSRSHAVVFSRPQTRRYGSQQAAQHARLEEAMTIDRTTAIQGTFWGMFQIGGFNWRKCGTESIEEFVTLMSRSEHDQLELFARFITNSGLTPYLQKKNWAAFARGYNGPSYARRGYHKKLAAAYDKYKQKEE